MPDFTTCEFIILIPVVMFTALSVAVAEYYRVRNAWTRFDAMMRERTASDPQSAARETQG